jgi:predicted ATPase
MDAAEVGKWARTSIESLPMDGKRLLHSIRLQNLLSYGSEGVTLELEPLNVLIGPNASGKSNLIEAVSLFAAVSKNLMTPFRDGGAAEDWIWKGGGEAVAHLGANLAYEGGESLGYKFKFEVVDFRLRILEEVIASLSKDWLLRTRDHFRISSKNSRILDYPGTDPIDPLQSILSQFRDPVNYPQLSYVGDKLGQIAFFRGWPIGRGNPLRRAQDLNLPNDFLLEDGSNLGLILNDLQNRRATKRLLLEKLRLVYEGIEDVTTKVQGGAIQIFFHEEGLSRPIPAARLSDGTLHYLCLLTVLLHPEPPPLICIEEPELGLHPDIIPKIADLLVDASKRTQLIVTTHSETLVSRLSDVPESIVICERDDQGTHLRRLDPEKMRAWLDKYALGELWRMGEIGGNRW